MIGNIKGVQATPVIAKQHMGILIASILPVVSVRYILLLCSSTVSSPRTTLPHVAACPPQHKVVIIN